MNLPPMVAGRLVTRSLILLLPAKSSDALFNEHISTDGSERLDYGFVKTGS